MLTYVRAGCLHTQKLNNNNSDNNNDNNNENNNFKASREYIMATGVSQWSSWLYEYHYIQTQVESWFLLWLILQHLTNTKLSSSFWTQHHVTSRIM